MHQPLEYDREKLVTTYRRRRVECGMTEKIDESTVLRVLALLRPDVTLRRISPPQNVG